jgi:hypothetical protein
VIGVSAGGRKLGDMRLRQDGQVHSRSFSPRRRYRDRDGNLVVELTSSSVLPPTQNRSRSLSFTINKIWLDSAGGSSVRAALLDGQGTHFWRANARLFAQTRATGHTLAWISREDAMRQFFGD